jgi:monoamine oxidase
MTETFDYIICAIPFSTLREVEIKPLFSNRKMQAIKEFNYIDAQRTVFLCNRRFWEEDTEYGRIIGGISSTDLPIQLTVYPSDHALYKSHPKPNPDEPGVLVASYSTTLDGTRLGSINEQRRTEVIKRNVEEVHGLPKGYLDSVVMEYKTVHWNAEPWFRGAFAITFPEQKSIFSYNILKPEYNNRIFFAGEHTSSKHGWMQGALHSGKLAANMLAYNSKLKNYSNMM